MHPINTRYFGTAGIEVHYFNGTALVPGYITKQTQTNTFKVTDGANPAVVSLAPTTALANAIYVSITGTTVSGSATITSLSATTNVLAGSAISGSGIPVGTTIVSVNTGASTMVISKVATASASGVTLTLTNAGYCNIFVHPPAATGSGGTFTITYAGSQSAVVNGAGSNGTLFAASDTLTASVGSTVVTVGTVTAGVITSATVTTAGSVTSVPAQPVTCTRGTGSGATLAAHYAVDSIAIVSGGSGFTTGSQTLTLAGSTGTAATFTATVAGGVVTNIVVLTAGDMTVFPSNPAATTGGGSTNATFTVKYKLLSIASSGGTNYHVGDTFNFPSLVATTPPTAHISVATTGAATTAVVDTAGAGITTATSGLTTTGGKATFTLGYTVTGIASSGGAGYAVNQQLIFNGIVAAVNPNAHLSVAAAGAATTTVVDYAGSNITVGASSVTVASAGEHIKKLTAINCSTLEGNTYHWTVGSSVNGSAFIHNY